jgi:predicted signal transduction protein with EAL and GGDEF domain
MEVTEDEIIHDLQIANEVAGALRAFNCTLALDDFGAGYSSLARLRQLPFSELKIDRSYVMNCHIDKVSAGLCEVIVQLGRRFGLKTVAEGIELTHECHKLQAAGCDIGQGYLFAKPLPKNQLIGMMSRRLVGRPAGEAQSATPVGAWRPACVPRADPPRLPYQRPIRYPLPEIADSNRLSPGSEMPSGTAGVHWRLPQL